jgi:maltose alpha-D-glucosyltransferase/alpha-amylase
MLGYVPFPPVTGAPYAITLAPYSFLWIELQPSSSRSEPQPQIEAATVVEVPAADALAVDLVSGGWAGLLGPEGGARFDAALRVWLQRQRWFGAKMRRIQSTRVVDWVEIPAAPNASDADVVTGGVVPPALVFIEIEYSTGLPETYQLPLGIATGEEADELIAGYPLSVLASFPSAAGTIILQDATVRDDFREALLGLIEQSATLEFSARAATAGELNQPGLPDDSALRGVVEETDGASPARAPAVPVAPVPITAQPGEAAPPPRDDASGSALADAQQQVPREPPQTGLPLPPGARLNARASSAFADAHASRELPSRVGSAEQSNTSILYGNRMILKLFRRIQPGENPDVEIGRFLTEVAHYPLIPPFLGEIAITSATGEKTTLAMMQGLVANQGDGWQWFLGQLAGFFNSVAALPAPARPRVGSFLDDYRPPGRERGFEGPALEAVALLGRRTAEMHLALATPTADPAFAAEPFTVEDLERAARRIDAQITATLEAIKAKLSTLEDSIADQAALLLSRRIDLFARANAITGLAAAGQRIRIHGDFHLGQTLRTGDTAPGSGDFVLLDFEGEPARPLAERRQKQSPLKDVAGMIRSLSYAAYTALDQYLVAHPELAGASGSDELAAWAISWQNTAASTFLRAYRQTIAANPALLPSPEQSRSLLGAYLLEKALYELLYELNNRPTWLHIPLSGILTL